MLRKKLYFLLIKKFNFCVFLVSKSELVHRLLTILGNIKEGHEMRFICAFIFFFSGKYKSFMNMVAYMWLTQY